MTRRVRTLDMHRRPTTPAGAPGHGAAVARVLVALAVVTVPVASRGQIGGPARAPIAARPDSVPLGVPLGVQRGASGAALDPDRARADRAADETRTLVPRAAAAASADAGTRTSGRRAAQPHAPLVSPDRPGFSFTPGTLPGGALQLEVGATDQHVGAVTYRTVGETLLRIGLGDATELRIAGHSLASREEHGTGRTAVGTGTTASFTEYGTEYGIEDARLGVKRRVLAPHAAQGLAATSIGVIAGTTVPTGSAAFGAHAWQPEAVLTVATPITAHLTLVENVSESWAAPRTTPHGARAHRLGATVAGAYALGSRWTAFGEYAGTRVTGAHVPASHYLDAGVTFVPVGHLQLDLRVGAGMNGVHGDRFVGAGVVRRW